MSSVEPTAVDRAWDLSESVGIDLDDVREIETDTRGVTVRVLAVDADDERDQVGFDVTRPPGDMGREMFDRRLREGLRELKRVVNRGGDETDDELDSVTEPDTEDIDRMEEDEFDDRENLSTNVPSTEVIETVGMRVSLDDGSLQDLCEELDDVFEQFDDRAVSEERVDELEDRLDDVDSRLTALEEQLSMLGNVNS